MADNTTLNPGSLGDTIASDDIGGVKYPRSKIVIGADGSNDGDVSSSNPMPVSLASVPSHAVTNAGTFAVQPNSSKVEDAAHSSGDTGCYILSVRSDAGAASAGTDGDYQNVITDASGRLWCISAQSGTWNITNISGTISLPTGAATAAKQPAIGTAGTPSADVISIQGVSSGTVVPISDGGGSLTVDGTVSISGVVPGTSATSLGKAEDAVPADGDTGVMMLAIRKDTAATTVGSDGDYHPLEVDANGNLWTMAKQSGTWNIGTLTTITNVVHVDDNSGSLTVDAPVGTPAFVRLSDGSAAITTLPVSLASVPSHAVTNSGTFAVQATEADGANTTLGAKADAKSTATDTTAITIMQVLKQISASVQAPPSQAVTNAGTFAVQAALETGSISNAGTGLTPKFAKIAASSSGDNTIVAAVTSKKIRVLAYHITGNAAVNAKWQSGAAGTDLTGLEYIAAQGGGLSAPFSPVGWFESASGVLLNLNLSGAVAVGGCVVYVEV